MGEPFGAIGIPNDLVHGLRVAERKRRIQTRNGLPYGGPAAAKLWLLTSSRFWLNDPRDGIRQPLPLCGFFDQLFTTGCGERIKAGLTVV